MKSLLTVACSTQIIRSSLIVSLVVGTVLNIINQKDNAAAGEAISWCQVIINYVVPYLVASYSAAKNELSRDDAK